MISNNLSAHHDRLPPSDETDRIVQRQNRSPANNLQPLITLFAIPKPFDGSVDLIQRNAIASWSRLQPIVDVLLLGDGTGIEDVAQEYGVRHSAELAVNKRGTPLLSSAFKIAHEQSSAPILVYCNSDVILLDEFAQSIERLHRSHLSEFVAFGRRTDLSVAEEIRFEETHVLDRLIAQCRQRGKACSVVCKEFFAYSRNVYQSIPDFAVGRGNWDNWMIHSAKQRRIPVVDVSSAVTVIHQIHDYAHTGGGRWKCYVSGSEAQENQRLAGGRNLISGSTGTWKLEEVGVRKIQLERMHLSFWADLPRFLRLMMNLMIDR